MNIGHTPANPVELPGNAEQKSRLSRRDFLILLSAAAGAAALTGCKGNNPSSASEGYSIFHETMVELPWTEIEQAAKDGAIVLLPVAVIEEHGPHLSLGVDTYLTYLWAKITCRSLLARGIRTLIAPPYYWGINVSTGKLPGSFTVREETMKAVLYDIHDSLNRWGFKTVFSFNLHGDMIHYRVLKEAIAQARKDLGMETYFTEAPSVTIPGKEIPPGDYHAGAYETAWMEAYFPEEVDLEIAKTLQPRSGFDAPGYYGSPAKYDLFTRQEIIQWQDDFGAATADWIEATLKSSGQDKD